MAEKKKPVRARAVKRASAKPAPVTEPPAVPERRPRAKPAPAKAAPPKAATKAASKPAKVRTRAAKAAALAEPPTPRARPAPRPRRPRASPARVVVGSAFETPAVPAPLTEEERIESSKYAVREPPRRVFEEERFLFPETYQADRVRLMVKDPEWLFAHWDVSPGSLRRLRENFGERATALSRLTLRLEDPAESALSVVLLPEGARSWYVRTHAAHRSYRASLGVTMPSGEFRSLATSNMVVAPRGGPSPQKARRVIGFSRAQAPQAAAELQAAGTLSAGEPERAAAPGAPVGERAASERVDYIDGTDAARRPGAAPGEPGGASGELGGASDAFRK